MSRRALPVVAIAAVAVAVFAILRGSDGSRLVRAEFAHANQLRVGDQVRVDGVEVGEVHAIDRGRGGRGAAVALELTDDRVLVTRAARAEIRWGTLLGGHMYVALFPGTPTFRGDRADTIPASQTSSQVEFDNLTQVFDGSTPDALRAQLRGTRIGFSDPAATHELLGAIAPTSRTLARGLSPLLGRRTDDLGALVASTARTLRALGGDQPRLGRVTEGLGATLAATGQAHAQLAAAIDATPPALQELRTTSRRLRTTLDVLDPLVDDLHPAARRLDATLAQTQPALRSAASLLSRAEPLLRDLSPAVASLSSASRQGIDLVRGLNPTLERTRDDLLPWLNRTDQDAGRTTAQMIGPTLSAAAGAASEFDGEGYWLRFAPSGGERLLLSAPCLTFFTDPTVDQKVRCDQLQNVLSTLFHPPGR